MSSGSSPLNNVIILLPGWAAKPSDPENTWDSVLEYLDAERTAFFVPHLYHRFGSIDERAESAIDEISEIFYGLEVHLIGHSLGGLVARFIAARNDLPFTVRTITTLGSPHHGIKYLNFLPRMNGDGGLASIIRWMLDSDYGGIFNVTPKSMDEFNAKTPNNPAVQYFSWAGRLRPYQVKYVPVLAFVSLFHPYNDGVVGVESAKWGIHLGTVKCLSHSKIVSAKLIAETIPYLRMAESGG
ncbi:alpha/beta-hydrolase [Coprinellus micaceus]|uniref:Alpha/beta-hydrolase n=1 Tax=Coprinellus micaceus TaxID=71717 RepID=A0A4Y7SJT3_COPMI|nr:alpha/beta-hydrolase [Coprinellus micaceus]